MTNVIIDAGTLTANKEERIVTGMLLPYGEECRSNLGRFAFDEGAVELPTDLTGMSLNIEHEREAVVGAPLSLTETSAGVVATFKIAATPEGDAALADIESGKRKNLSAEVSGVRIKDGKGVAGRLFASALVERPAFPSATLLAAAADTEDEAAETPEAPEAEVTAEVTETPDETVAVDNPKTGDESEDESEERMPEATAPATLNAGKPAEQVADKTALFSAITNAAKFGNTTELEKLAQDEQRTGLFAFSDIKISGSGAVGTGVVQPAYIGEVWSGRTQQRKVIPLLSSGNLTALEVKGWRWTQKPEVDTWAGNKSDVPSNTPTTEAYTLSAQRFAGGHDIAREFVDFGVTEVLDGYSRAMADSYAIKSDNYALAQLIAGATTAEVGDLPADVGSAIGKIVEGALRVVAAGALPSFAIVATDVYRELAFTKKDDVLAFLSLSLGLEEGSMEAFRIVPHAGMTAGNVLVGAKEAAKVHELPGAPIRVSALDLAKGGYDEAIFGYIAVGVEYAEGIQLVTPDTTP